jgi:hypothetical protein
MLEIVAFLVIFYVGCIAVGWITYKIIERLP